jgi:Cys-tRNA(Pro)/Cys-tRNA(Cys) deacylase
MYVESGPGARASARADRYHRAMPGAGTRAVDAVRAAGVAHALHEYELPERTGRERDTRPSYGLDTAAALDVEPERLLKTLVALVDGSPVLAMVPVAAELDLGALAAAVRGRRAEMADPAQAEKLTGYQVGGISPLGVRRALPLVLDETAVLFDTVLCSAGRRGLQLELSPDDLIRLTNAQLAEIGRAR